MLAVDSGPGLLVKNFSINGVDDVVDAVGGGPTTLRLYPTNLIEGNRRVWQGVYDSLSNAEAKEDDNLLFFAEGSCQTWSVIGLETYGLRALDQFVLEIDGEGRGVGLDARAWRTGFRRD